MTVWEPLSSFLPHLNPFVPDAPHPMAMTALRTACAEFCEMTSLWRELVEFETPEEPTRLEPAPESSIIVRIEAAQFEDIDLDPVALVDLPMSGMGSAGDRGVPRKITQVNENDIILYPWPMEPGTVTMSLILKPEVGARYGAITGGGTQQDAQNRVPRFLFTNYADTIAHGAAGRLMTIPRQSFTDPAAAQYHFAEFARVMQDKASSSFRGQQRARVRIKAQWI